MADQPTNTPGNNTPEAPKPGSAEYNNAMIDRLEKGTGTVTDEQRDKPPVPAIPEGGSDKFYNKDTGVYDWASHAKELQFKLDQTKGKAPEKKDGEKPSDTPEKKDGDENADAAVEDIVTKAGLKVEDLTTQLQTNGKLDDAAVQALVKNGIPQNLIDEYVEGWKARSQVQTQTAYDYVGGEKAWTELHNWAVANLDQTEKDRYNAMLRSPDWTVAVDALKAKMGASSPTAGEGQLRGGDNVVHPSATGYRSRAAMIAEINSDKYKTDPTFRAQVQQRIAVSRYEDDGV